MDENYFEGEMLELVIEDRAATDGQYAIAYALLKLAEASEHAAKALDRLGMNDADMTGPPGALENIGMVLQTIADRMSS